MLMARNAASADSEIERNTTAVARMLPNKRRIINPVFRPASAAEERTS